MVENVLTNQSLWGKKRSRDSRSSADPVSGPFISPTPAFVPVCPPSSRACAVSPWVDSRFGRCPRALPRFGGPPPRPKYGCPRQAFPRVRPVLVWRHPPPPPLSPGCCGCGRADVPAARCLQGRAWRGGEAAGNGPVLPEPRIMACCEASTATERGGGGRQTSASFIVFYQARVRKFVRLGEGGRGGAVGLQCLPGRGASPSLGGIKAGRDLRPRCAPPPPPPTFAPPCRVSHHVLPLPPPHACPFLPPPPPALRQARHVCSRLHWYRLH